MEIVNSTSISNSREVKVYSNALSQGLGCVLRQNRRVIDFASIQLRPHKRNYLTYDLELAVVIHTFKI